MADSLESLVHDARVLTGAQGPRRKVGTKMEAVLESRLHEYYRNTRALPATLDGLQREMARCACAVLLALDSVLLRVPEQPRASDGAEIPLISLTDWKCMRQLVGVACEWGVRRRDSSIITNLVDICRDGRGTHDSRQLKELVRTETAPHLVPQLLLSNMDYAQVFLGSLNRPRRMELLLRVMNSAVAPPVQARLRSKAISLLTHQFAQPQGVQSLIALLVLINEEKQTDPTESLDMLVTMLTKVPSSYTEVEQARFRISTTAQLVHIVHVHAQREIHRPEGTGASRTSALVLRMACYLIVRLIESDSRMPQLESGSSTQDVPIGAQLLTLLHKDLLATQDVPSKDIALAVYTLSIIVAQAPPSPTLFPRIIAPVLPVLLILKAVAFASKASLLYQDEMDVLLQEWLRADADSSEAAVVASVLRTVEMCLENRVFPSERCVARDDSGALCVCSGDAQYDHDAIIAVAADWVRHANKPAVAGRLIMRCVSECEAALRKDLSPTASLWKFHLGAKLIDLMGVDHIRVNPVDGLAFAIDQVGAVVAGVQSETDKPTAKSENDPGLGEEPDFEDTSFLGNGITEQMPLQQAIAATSLVLVLAFAQDDWKPTPRAEALVGILLNKCQELAQADVSADLTALARQVRLVVASLRAVPQGDEDHVRSAFAQAMSLVADASVPVRAQGLTELRHWALSVAGNPRDDLVSEALDIFFDALGDSDSYIYLNAIQSIGELAFVDAYARRILKRLVAVYAGLDHAGPSLDRMDVRLRAGEAFLHIVKKAGETFSIYVEDVAPSLLSVFADNGAPTPLRVSSLSILSVVTNTAPLAALPFVHTLVDGVLTLLSLESVSRSAKRHVLDDDSAPTGPLIQEISENEEGGNGDNGDSGDENGDNNGDSNGDSNGDNNADGPAPVAADAPSDDTDLETMARSLARSMNIDLDGDPAGAHRPEDVADPLSTDTGTNPALRRAALVFLADVFDAAHERHVQLLNARQISRTRTMLDYVLTVDEDDAVRRIAADLVKQEFSL